MQHADIVDVNFGLFDWKFTRSISLAANLKTKSGTVVPTVTLELSNNLKNDAAAFALLSSTIDEMYHVPLVTKLVSAVPFGARTISRAAELGEACGVLLVTDIHYVLLGVT